MEEVLGSHGQRLSPTTELESLNWLEKGWNRLLTTWPYSDALLFTLVSQSIFVILIVGINVFLYFCYTRNLWPHLRINSNYAKFPDKPLIYECIKVLCINYSLKPFVLYFSYVYLFAPRGMSMAAPFPSLMTMAWQIVVFTLIRDTLHYWIHRLFHHPLLYPHIHKVHHRFHYAIGIAFEFAHPVEDVFLNSLPIMVGPLVLGSHIVTMWVWVILILWEAIDAHSGYHFRWSPWYWFPSWQGGPDRHDYHHSHNIGSYGAFLSFWDWAMGTDRPFKRWYAQEQAKRGAKQAPNS